MKTGRRLSLLLLRVPTAQRCELLRSCLVTDDIPFDSFLMNQIYLDSFKALPIFDNKKLDTYFLVPNRRGGSNKQEGWADFFIFILRLCIS